ncbi:MAG TPA: sugar phosphate nucleotidyltransferase [Patescibacteria group bacterium]|nr:sugar phosphate nucleotidyltransferase [Patescibacteria group bacterium]
MQAVLLGAGQSSRFFPFNDKHKCLVSLLGEPIIVHTVRSIKRAGINDILFVVSQDNAFQDVLGNGKKYGVKIRYVIQKEPNGMGDALLQAKDLIDSDFFLVNSNHIEFEELKSDIDVKRTNREAILLGVKNNSDKHFGMLKLDGDKVLGVEEKPKNQSGLSDLRIVGVYFLNIGFLDVLAKTKKGHYSFEDALDKYAKLGKVKVCVTSKEIMSLKYPWDLLRLKNYLLSKVKRSLSKKANISKHAIIDGNVIIEEGATILENATVKGPAYIGRNAFVGSNSLVRNGSSVEENSVVGGYMEVKNSIIMSDSKTHSGHFEDSILGQNSRIGALFTSANVRLDRRNIKVNIKGEDVDSGLRDLGTMIGSNTNLGARVTTMPGVIIGDNSFVGPSTTVLKNIPSDTIFYAKFVENVSKSKSANTQKSSAPKKIS